MKIPEDANLKLGSVASDIPGVTGRRIIEATIAGQEHPDWLADKACGSLRNKRDQLRPALKGLFTGHHRYMLRELMEDLRRVEEKISRLEEKIEVRMKPHADAIERLMTIPLQPRTRSWLSVITFCATRLFIARKGEAALISSIRSERNGNS